MCAVKQKKTWRGCDSNDSFVTYKNCVVFLRLRYFSGWLSFFSITVYHLDIFLKIGMYWCFSYIEKDSLWRKCKWQFTNYRINNFTYRRNTFTFYKTEKKDANMLHWQYPRVVEIYRLWLSFTMFHRNIYVTCTNISKKNLSLMSIILI